MGYKPIKIFIFLFLAIAFVAGCANRGRPTGGEIDTEPPVIKRLSPQNFTTNFDTDEIIIEFDEFVKMTDVQKRLIISPPLDNIPAIFPLGGASKTIKIKIKDTLQANTTYAFNFGQSIVDNNEENPYPYFRYVFSTGEVIDSLSVNGYVVDALLERPDTFVSVMLYEADSTYTDSIVYKEKPRYITNTLDSVTTFSIENIKEGKYKLIAMKDLSNNYIFNQKDDKIGFAEEFISVPTDSVYELKLFRENVNFKAIKPKQESASKIIFPYEGSHEQMRIKILGETPQGFEHKITKDAEADTLYYWYKPQLEVDTTFFVVTNEKSVDTFKHRFRSLALDTLTVNSITSGTLTLEQDFVLKASTPIVYMDESKVNLMDKDSTLIPFQLELDTLLNRIRFKIVKEESQKYSMTVYPGAFTDFYNEQNKDTLNFTLRTKKTADYGNIRVNLRNAKLPLIVQLTDGSGEVKYELYAKTTPVVDFTELDPGKYSLRVVYDTNANGKYDPGNFLLAIQPERVSYYPALDEVRANFDQIIEFNLLD